MTQQEEYRLRQMIEDLMKIQSSMVEGHFKVIDEKLDKIDIQVNKTNGRVTKLEGQVVVLEKDELVHKTTWKHIGIAGTIISGVILIGMAVIELFQKIKV